MPKQSKNAWHAVPDVAGAPDGTHAGRTETDYDGGGVQDVG